MGVQGTGKVVFREEQQFRQPWLIALFAIFVVVDLVSISRVEDTPTLRVMVYVTVAMFLLAAFFFCALRLVTEVQEDRLAIRFWPFRERRFDYKSILRCEARTYRPIREYGGWGIRYGFRTGLAYNVSGNRGVQLEMNNGNRVLIGSQRADELAEAIRQQMQMTAGLPLEPSSHGGDQA